MWLYPDRQALAEYSASKLIIIFVSVKCSLDSIEKQCRHSKVPFV